MKTITARLDDDDISVLSRMNEKDQTSSLKKALRFAGERLNERADQIIRIKNQMEAYEISFDEIGADYKSARDEEARELLRRLRKGLKKFGKKKLGELIDAECRRYGVEKRGGNNVDITAEQNSPVPSQEQKAYQKALMDGKVFEP